MWEFQSQAPVRAPGVAGGLLTVSTLLLLQSIQGSQSNTEPVLRSRGQPSGSSQ